MNIMPFPDRKYTEYCNVHSRKPDIFYEWAETFGDKRIDMFARNKRNGWDVWGNEVQ